MKNYEFHVGDFVQTKDDKIGYITEVNKTMNCIMWKNLDGVEDGWAHSDNALSTGKYFKRIGQYDFTKLDVEKIEHLTEQDKEMIGKFPDGTKVAINRYVNDNYCKLIYNDGMIDKINQLVDAVNKLNEKI